MFRLPGGSRSDDFHFNAPPTYNGEGTVASMASFIASVSGQGVVTLDYGSGSPQEAAAFLAYLNAPVGNTTPIGTGRGVERLDQSWQKVNWQTAGYWASLRASAPLAVDDGLNFLRTRSPRTVQFPLLRGRQRGVRGLGDRPSRPGGVPGSRTTRPPTSRSPSNSPRSPRRSLRRSRSASTSAAPPWQQQLDAPTSSSNAPCQGFTPGFISDHNYVQAPGKRKRLEPASGHRLQPQQPELRPIPTTGPCGPLYQNLLSQYLGASRQERPASSRPSSTRSTRVPASRRPAWSTACSSPIPSAALLETPYNGADVWDLRNDYETGNNNSSSLYGWRQGGDYGLLGSPAAARRPRRDTYVPYPTYFAEQLVSKIIQAGGNVVQASEQ